VAVNLGDLFGKDSAFGQLMIWQVGAQVVGAIMAPGLSELTQLVNEKAPVEPLTPATLADLVVRNYLDKDSATATARRSGVSPEDFALMVTAAGEAVDTTTLIEGYRRKILGWDTSEGGMPSVVDGIREGHLADKWAPLIKALGDVPLGVADAVDAAVEGQISMDQAVEIAYQNGISAENFKILYGTRGNPPAPSELAEMVRRGIIPAGGTGPDALSFDQGISEGATKDKWITPLRALMTVLPAEGRVTTLLRNGVISRKQAIAYYQQLGYDQVAATAFADDASAVKTAADKLLAKSDVIKLYADGAVTRDTASGLLTALGYDATEAGWILTIQDLHTATAATDAAISRIQSYFIARKIDTSGAVNALNALNVPAAQQTTLITAWTIARTSNVKLLTESQIADAWAYKIIDTAAAVAELQALGYTELDAWIVLSIKNKAPITDQAPAQGPSPLTGGAP
jgi:hypothetical protein